MRKTLFVLVLIQFNLFAFTQLSNERKATATRIENPPRINGVLDDECWAKAKVETDFYQFEPFNGEKPSEETTLRILYDDEALYIGAFLYDSSPDSIMRNLSSRDSWMGTNSDLFTMLIGPFNDGINMVEFMVSASGVQSDGKHSGDRSDGNWNAVWNSAVKINDEGWVVEMKIPYSALRIPNKDVHEWGFHAFRAIERKKEWSTWNYADNEIQGLVNQAGSIVGIRNIKPPLRLSLTPYTSAYVEHNTETGIGTDFNVGMDLKYGINESFTLDMTLIPDFGQVKSDDVIYNLSPFEVHYDENRPFFMEGTELFRRGNIFYSRRVGSVPKYFDEAYGNTGVNEVVSFNPTTTSMINATKLSGRTNSGLGIGVFNAMTNEAFAEIEDTITGEIRSFRTQGFTNYNMFVLDQNLPNNSYLSYSNTLVNQFKDNYNAHVSAVDFSIRDKQSRFKIGGSGALSSIYNVSSKPEIGHKYHLYFEKIRGKFTYEFSGNVESDTYNPNDLGFLRANNEISLNGRLNYVINEPFWILRNFRTRVVASQEYLYNPREFKEFSVHWNVGATIQKNFLSIGTYGGITPVESYDYYEPRVWGRYYKSPEHYYIGAWISTDFRKPFAVEFRGGMVDIQSEYEQFNWDYAFEPRLRINSKSLLLFEIRNRNSKNNIGYVTYYEQPNENYDIKFGSRDLNVLTNELEFQYTFTNKLSFNFRLRHYWSRVDYNAFYTLNENGTLSDELDFDSFGTEYNVNYNAFNIDANLLWHFAPGSDLSVVWKNAIYQSDENVALQYFTNLQNVLESDQINSFSVKLIYYLDYQDIKKLF